MEETYKMIKNTLIFQIVALSGLIFAGSCMENEFKSLNDNNPEIPSSYDLREHNLITPVKDQNGKKEDGSSDIGTSVGLCWAFSSLAGLESNMLKQGIVKDPDDDEANLSPWYLGNYIGYNNPCYEFNSDTWPGVEPVTTFGYVSMAGGWGGGGAFWVADYLISGKELPLWKDSPMPTSEMTAQKTLTKPLPVHAKKYSIKNMTLLFSDDYQSEGEYLDSVKKFILKNGAVQSFVHLEPIDIEGISKQMCNGTEYLENRFMDKKNHDLYTYEADNLCTDMLTHAVTIAGWDDNRQINVNGHISTGCWLIKDSSGSMAHDNGYFWVAYDDNIINYMASGLIANPEDLYRHPSFYQTHSGGLSEIPADNDFGSDSLMELGKYGYLLNGFKDDDSWAFGKFEIEKDEKLAAVAIFTSSRNEVVTVNIYKNSEKNDPELSKEFNIEEIGYHLLDLGDQIEFSKSEIMVIGIGFKYNADSRKLPLIYVMDNEYIFKHPTYFGTLENGSFKLTPYTELCEKCSFFLQAVVTDK